MSKLTILDIVALAKAGFKAQDIKDLTSVEVPDPEPTPAKDTPGDDKKDTENPAKVTGKGEPSPDGSANDIDYKKLYEDKCAELEAAQKKNAGEPIPKPEKQTVTVADIVRDFM